MIYVVREWVEGTNLKDIGTQSEQKIKQFLEQIIEIVKYVHSEDIILRDLKISNFVLTSDGRLKLIEVCGALEEGEAKIQERNHESTMFHVGSPFSTAPELFSPCKQSDIWSIGSIIADLYLGDGKKCQISSDEYDFSIIENKKLRTIVEKAMQYRVKISISIC